MSKRLQVILGDAEFDQLRTVARREGVTVSEWVRGALRRARQATPSGELDAKLAALRSGLRHDFPTADIDDMLREVERGYRS